jgi:hypothetical protein
MNIFSLRSMLGTLEHTDIITKLNVEAKQTCKFYKLFLLIKPSL